MVTCGYCPCTAVASIATCKLDALVFIGGFLIGSLVFGDFFPVWGNFYDSNYLGTFRLDQWLGIGLGPMVFILIVVAVAGSYYLQIGLMPDWRVLATGGAVGAPAAADGVGARTSAAKSESAQSIS